MKSSLKSASIFASACVAVLVLTSCSSGSAISAQDSAQMTIKPGVLTVGTSIPFAPMEYFDTDGVTPVGVDMDLMAEVARRLDLELDIQSTAWDGLIPAVKANRYDVVAAALGDFTDRQIQLDFVDYLSVRSAVVVKADGEDFADAMALCGKSIGGASGSVAITIVQRFSDDCEAGGNPAITIMEFTDAAGLVAVRSARSDAHIMDGPSAAYQAQTTEGGKAYKIALEAVGPEAIYGIGINKENNPLRDAVAEQLNAMITDGTYQSILEEYGVEAYAIAEATVNAGGDK